MLFKPKSTYRKVGISHNENYFCAVVKNNQQYDVQWYNKSQFRLSEIFNQLELANKKICKIYAINDRFIWRKYLFFPANYSTEMLYRQMITLLKQELPIAIEDIYFDYQILLQPENNLKKVILYALKKDCQQFENKDKTIILDSEIYCYKRGLTHLFKLDENLNEAENGYVFQDQIIQFKQQEFCQTAIENSEQISDCKRLYFFENLQKIPKIKECELILLPSLDEKTIRDPYLYLTALGATLWNGKV
ncbi:Uncharacterised protein [Phocoenobacter uteri]|uniref:Competence protein A n=2 Tax=Phocoenobacter uteri TaxID=146806 RepID=A0A379C7C8_9PAST|nr:hypothetical protein [Phocoenobacter uteri]SUB58121.1 Uncharacterised protein [Phocoenobacter uteri]